MKKILLDCDPGIDDALTIMLAINSAEISLEGITTVHGNSPLEQTTKNALRLLDYFKKDIPVVKGASKPLKYEELDMSGGVHGKDGLGDSTILPKDSNRSFNNNAIEFIIEQVKSGIKTIVATGPLTNIALAFKKDPKTMNSLDELVIMGGVLNEYGNIDRLSEFNFYADPHAADFVLQQPVRKVLIPLNVTRKVVLTPQHVKNLRETKTTKLIRTITKKYQDFYIKVTDLGGNPLHDPLALGYVIDPSFVELQSFDLKVESEGKYTRGVCVPELRGRAEKRININVALKVDSKRFMDYFLKTISK